MLVQNERSSGSPAPFVHSALLYHDDDQYLAGTIPFIEEGLEAGEAVMVSVPEERLALIQATLGSATDDVMFAPMERLGRNPAWIIPAWADFVQPFVEQGLPARGIGEPIWAARSDAELVECVRHEALLNHALTDATGFQLLCPYDTGTLDGDVIETAHRNHPCVEDGERTLASDHYELDIAMPMTDPLPPAPSWAETVAFDELDQCAVREHVARVASARGLSGDRLDAFTVAVSEALANSVAHGGGGGELAHWSDGKSVQCEVRDRGRILDPMAGRVKPGLDQDGGRGLWLMNQLCDLVQIRMLADATQVVRLHMAI